MATWDPSDIPGIYPKMARNSQKKMAKAAKNGQKSPKIAKKGWFCTAKFVQKEKSFAIFFPVYLFSLSEKSNLDTKTLIRDSVYMEIFMKKIATFHNIS